MRKTLATVAFAAASLGLALGLVVAQPSGPAPSNAAAHLAAAQAFAAAHHETVVASSASPATVGVCGPTNAFIYQATTNITYPVSGSSLTDYNTYTFTIVTPGVTSGFTPFTMSYVLHGVGPLLGYSQLNGWEYQEWADSVGTNPNGTLTWYGTLGIQTAFLFTAPVTYQVEGCG
jgi:hypothetical protein